MEREARGGTRDEWRFEGGVIEEAEERRQIMRGKAWEEGSHVARVRRAGDVAGCHWCFGDCAGWKTGCDAVGLHKTSIDSMAVFVVPVVVGLRVDCVNMMVENAFDLCC